MNEEQSEDLIMVLREIRDLIKPRQEVNIVTKEVSPIVYERLTDFKLKVCANEFYSTLTEKQKKYIHNIKVV